jgi:hypothetical protein
MRWHATLMGMSKYTNPQTGRSEEIIDSRALATKEERIAFAQAEQAAFEARMDAERAARRLANS